MKASFFSVVALAMSAFAAPLTQDNNVERSIDIVAPMAEARDVTESLPEKRTNIMVSADVIAHLDGCVKAVADLTVSISASVKTIGTGRGKISADACVKATAPILAKIKLVLLDVKAQLKVVGGVKISAQADVQIIVALLVKLVTNLLLCVRELVIAVGLRVELKAVLKLVCIALGDILHLVCGLVPGIFVNVVARLNPLLGEVKATALVSCLGDVLGAKGGLALGLKASLGLKAAVGI